MLLNISLDTIATPNSISTLVRRGLEIGLQYRGEHLQDQLLIIKMTKKVLDGFVYQRSLKSPTLSCDITGVAHLNIQAHDTFFALFFYEKNNYITLSLSPDWDLWYKTSREEGCIDWERYIKLMLEFCKDFPITKIETWDSYYDE